MLALILGGAPAVWDDLAAAQAVLGPHRPLIVACNMAGFHFGGRINAWCSLHPERRAEWAAARRGNADYRWFVPTITAGPYAEVVAERWPGSSGLYAAQIALFELGASAAILCGVPMDSEAGHFAVPGPWATTRSYRRAFVAALPVIGGRLRSMGGWTASLLGSPTAAWVSAVATAKPLATPRLNPEARLEMHNVKNTSKTTQRFFQRPAAGGGLVRLAPGEEGVFDIDPLQPRFTGGGLSISKVAPKTTPAKSAETAGKA